MTRNRVFLVSLGVSIVFHLSMVTVFSIGVYFPREEIDYHYFEIVDLRSYAPTPTASVQDPSFLSNPMQNPLAESEAFSVERLSLDGLADRGEESAEAPFAALPEIELPRLEFAELDRLRVREHGLDFRARHGYPVGPRPQDSWARFGQELERIGEAVTRLPLWDWLETERREEQEGIQPITRPAPGFAGYLEWMSAPEDRQLLFAPPLDTLGGVDPAGFAPLSFVLRISPEGRVTEIITPIEGGEELVAGLGRQILRYRFEPDTREQPRDQHASLVIAGDYRP